MTRAHQRRVLEVFSRDHTRELHSLLAADLGAQPQFVFQQLYNRLQWRAGAGGDGESSAAASAATLLAALLRPAFSRRSTAAPLWLHALTRLQDSEALSRTYDGHTSAVLACAFSPDGQTIVSAGHDETLKLWDARSGAQILSFPALGALRACAFSPLGDCVCCGGAGGAVTFLELTAVL